jgi:Uma2 family endonuclease
MATVLDLARDDTSPPTVVDLSVLFGPMPVWRIRTDPPPGFATEKDLVRIHSREDRLFELADGTLVKKTVGTEESELAIWIAVLLSNYIRPRKLGSVLGADAMIRLRKGLVRVPDTCFIAVDRLPGGKLPRKGILDIAPNLVVEVLSPSNTAKEMRRKLREYFKAGVELVWYVDPASHTVQVFTAPQKRVVLKESQTLTGGHVLPGFKVTLKKMFGG